MRRFTEDLILAFGSAVLLALTLIPAAQADTCSMKLKTLQFAGTFDWKNARTGKTEKMRFVIGTPTQAAGGALAPNAPSVAQIWSGGQCQASCSSVDLGSTPTGAMAKDELSMPISLDLQCRGEELGALSARVAVLWSHGAQSATTLRFGSWVDGYEQAALKVEVDHFSATNLAMDR